MKRRLLCMLLCAALALGLGTVMETPARAYSTGDDYPYKDKSYGTYRSEDIDPWNFYYRECTSFVAWCLNSRNAVSFHNYFGGVNWGNAGNWGTVARSLGYSVNMTPAVGAVAWWSEIGHVAWVKSVSGDSVVIEEYNHGSRRAAYTGGGYEKGCFDEATISAGSVDGYIHIQDLSSVSTAGEAKSDSTITSELNAYYNTISAGGNVYWNAYHSSSFSERSANWARLKADADNKNYTSCLTKAPCPSHNSYYYPDGCCSNACPSEQPYSYDIQCSAFASYLAYVLFGYTTGYAQANSTVDEHYTKITTFPSKFRPGDVIRYMGSGDNGHSVMVVADDGSTTTVLECNYGGRCLVRKREATHDSFKSSFQYVLSPNSNLRSDSPAPAAPSAPTNFTAVWSDTKWAANLSWTASSGATSYEVQYRTEKTNNEWRNDTDYTGGTSYTSTSLKDYASYDYRVRAVNAGGVSGWTTLTFYKTVTATFNANGGTVSPTSRSYTYDSANGVPATYGSLPTPSYSGYTFLGWYTAKSGGTKIATSTKVTATKNHTIYARWEKIPTYTVTFNSNGGSAVASQTVESGKTATKPTNPTKTGHTFAGWYKDTALTQEFNFSTPITANITLYAKWTANTYTVSYDANGGTGAPADQVKTYDVPLTLSTVIPTYEGYEFKHWLSDIGDIYHPGDAYTKNRKVTLTAVWEAQGNWSGWYTREEIDAMIASGVLPADVRLNEGTQYRYQYLTQTSYQDAKPTAPAGYETSGPAYVGNWGAWSGWQDKPVSEIKAADGTVIREVKTQQVEIASGYTRYIYGRWTDGTHWTFCKAYGVYKYGTSADSWRKETIALDRNERYGKLPKSNGQPVVSYHQPNDPPNGYHDHDGTGMFIDDAGDCCWYTYTSNGTDNASALWYWETSEYVQPTYKTQYSYRDQVPVYTHSKWESGEWTEWGEAIPFTEDATHKRNVETRTVYRYDRDTTFAIVGSFNSTTLSANVTAPTGTALIAVCYDASGRTVGVKNVSITEACTGKNFATGLSKRSGYTYKLMLVDGKTFAPLCKAWTGKA